ncbi:MAG: hypothetical protein M1838_001794 [Thelocarpon superellum]|nr:MAG: hypothetical protein M1838_001794 [Thelocarpon superellum]
MSAIFSDRHFVQIEQAEPDSSPEPSDGGSTTAEDPFPFLRLPSEIRNLVYYYVNCDGVDENGKERNVHTVTWTQKNRFKPEFIYSPPISSGHLALCRQIYSEARPMFWNNIEWKFNDTDSLCHFLEFIGHKRRRKMQHLSVTYYGTYANRAFQKLRTCAFLKTLELNLTNEILRLGFRDEHMLYLCALKTIKSLTKVTFGQAICFDSNLSVRRGGPVPPGGNQISSPFDSRGRYIGPAVPADGLSLPLDAVVDDLGLRMCSTFTTWIVRTDDGPSRQTAIEAGNTAGMTARAA